MSVSSVFGAIAKPFVFIGKAFVKVEEWVPKVIGIAAYSEEEAKTVVPAMTLIFKDTEALATLVVADGKKEWPALLALVSAIGSLSGAGAINPADYAKVISAVANFVTDMHELDYSAIFNAVETVVADYDALGADVKAAIEKFDAIVKQ